jgi:hypothetical protein
VQAQLDELVTIARKSPVTLFYGASDEEHNQARALSRVAFRASLGGLLRSYCAKPATAAA